MLRRAAWAALLIAGAISVDGLSHRAEDDAIPGEEPRANVTAENEPVIYGSALSKNVFKLNSSESPYGSLPCLQGIFYLGRYGEREIYHAGSNICPRWNGQHSQTLIASGVSRELVLGEGGIGYGPRVCQFVGRCLPVVFETDVDDGHFWTIEIADKGVTDKHIRAQLPSGSFVSVRDESRRSEPEHPSHDAQQPFTGLDPQYRHLGSVLASMLVLLLASGVYWRGWTMLGGIMAAYGIFGLLLRLDAWSLAIRVL